jgi:hypothetical protein
VLPLFQDFRPTRPAWDDLVDSLRNEKVEVYGFFRAFGPVPEVLLTEAWSVLAYLDDDEDALAEEGAIRTRRFMEDANSRYGKIVLFAHGPTMSTWTAGAIGTRATQKTDLVQMRRDFDGFGDWKLHRRIRRVLGLSDKKVDGEVVE